MTDQNVIALRTVTVEVNDTVVEMLTETLDRARKGEIQSVVFAASMTEGRTFTEFVTSDRVEAMGLAALLTHTLCARQRDYLLEESSE